MFVIPERKGILQTKEEALGLASQLTTNPKEMEVKGQHVWVKRGLVAKLFISTNILAKLPSPEQWMVVADSQFDLGDRSVLQVFKQEGQDLTHLPKGELCANMGKIEADLHNILVYLKEHRVIHRDIKPENLIWTGEKVKLIDLDTLIQLKEDEEYKDTNFEGTSEFIPEDTRYGRFGFEGEELATDAFAVKKTLEQIQNACKGGRRKTLRKSKVSPKTRKQRRHYKKNRKY